MYSLISGNLAPTFSWYYGVKCILQVPIKYTKKWVTYIQNTEEILQKQYFGLDTGASGKKIKIK